MAYDILYVPDSTLSSEAAFSTSGQVVFDNICGLNLKAIKALVCLRNSRLIDIRLHEE